MLDLRFGAATDVGLVRAHNEDSMLLEPPVFVVADGMGGHAHGEIASALVVSGLRHLVGRKELTVDEATAAVELLNGTIQEASLEMPAVRGMGTTAVGLIAVQHEGSPQWLAFNVGDSRLYRWVDGVLEQLSVDHSVVQELLDRGEITQAEVSTHPQRSVITRVLGTAGSATADYWLLPVSAGVRFLLCSDGLTTELGPPRIATVLAEHDDPKEAADALVAAALRAGGRDNVTAIVIDAS
jgi:PPM family protein phosphatase